MGKISVSVIGSCACRDFLEFGQSDFEVKTDIRFSSPISLVSKPLNNLNLTFDDLKKATFDVNGKWFKRTLINDINKTAFSSLKNKHGKYLLIDFCEARMNIAIIRKKGSCEEIYITHSGLFKKYYSTNLKNGALSGYELEIINPLSFSDNFWNSIMDQYVAYILSLFDEQNIILIENKPAHFYIDQNGKLESFKTDFHLNEIYLCELITQKLNNMFLSRCPAVRRIRIPDNPVGDSCHKWKTHPLHFNKLYYDYLLECLDSIAIKNNNDLTNIFNKYSILFNDILFKAKKDTVLSLKESSSIDFVDVINCVEEFASIGRKKKALILFACSKKHFFKNLKRLKK